MCLHITDVHLLTHYIFIQCIPAGVYVGGAYPCDAPTQHEDWRRRGRKREGAGVFSHKSPLWTFSVGVGGGLLKAIQPMARPPKDTPKFWE